MGFLPLELLVMFIHVFYSYVEALFKKVFPIRKKDIRGQIVLITGAGRGIGRELALEFASKGATLALWDIDESGVNETSVMVQERGATVKCYSCDVTDKAQVHQVAKQVKRDLGDVDILVNNAGIMKCKDIFSLTERDVRSTFDVNIVSHFWTIQEFLPNMMSRNQGHLVQIASMAGIVGSPYLTDYCASKFAVVGLSDALLTELAVKKKLGVRITTVCPKFVNTNLVTGLSERIGVLDRFGSLLQPTDVAREIVDGVLKNKYKVFLPKDMGLIPIVNSMMPMRGKRAMGEVLQTRFVDKINE